MSKRRRRSQSLTGGRDLSPIARTPVLPLPFRSLPRSSLPLSAVEDRRTFHPDPVRPAVSARSWRHRLVVSQTHKRPAGVQRQSAKNLISPIHRISFGNPTKLALCIRRSRRRQVLHALKKNGRVGQKRPRRNQYSSISCRG